MNKAEMIIALAERTGLKKTEAERAVRGIQEIVAETLKKGEKVQMVGFGTFEAPEREAREARNPKTGKTMKIPASRSVKFKAGRWLKEEVNQDPSQSPE
ncbi:MAG: HU family DNA-binding protein [Eubacterium sp.]|nr:HU family DNA-binding protein [Eubacterium sp.]